MPKASKRKFYRTIVTIEILSETPYDGDEDLADIAYSISDGDDSGLVTIQPSVNIDSNRAVELLKKQGSDPGFFRLNEDGSDMGDKEEEPDEDEGIIFGANGEPII